MSERVHAHVKRPIGPLVSDARAAPTLPPDLLQEASKRLGVVSLVYAITYASAFLIPHFLFTYQGVEHAISPVQWTASFVSIGASLLVSFLSLRLRIRPEVLLDVGLVYHVVAAFGIAMGEIWGFQVDVETMLESHFVGISWVCVWIVAFPTIVPNTPGKTLLASFAAANMPALVLLLSVAAGISPPIEFAVWVWAFMTTYLCVGMAFVCSRIIYKLGSDIRKARELGSYRLVEKLGEGGMGEVWKADHQMLARPAAIKLIRQESLGPDAARSTTDLQRRFEREAQATAALRSPHTVELYDFGVTDDGQFYYAMELLEGLNLDSLVERFGPLPAARVIHLLVQACDSLADAHQQGMVHRDIKPANLFACRLGARVDFVKVLDFGLVKPFRDLEGPTQLTVEGMTAGTPAFMAPEMVEGGSDIDGRADIYALGCVAYWLLTGSLVFDNDNPIQMALDHVRRPPTPPSERTEVEIPDGVEWIVLRCLEKDRTDRPSNAEKLAELLIDCDVPDVWDQEKARTWWNLHLPSASRGGPAKTADPTGERIRT